MNTFNGYTPDETRSSKHRPRKADKGHTIVERSTTRRGSSFSFSYRATCQCGASFGSRQSTDRVFYAYTSHLKKEGV